MPLGATPSRWCVCQFHHFRSEKLLTFNHLAGKPLRVCCGCTGFCTDPALAPIRQRELLSRLGRKLEKQLLDRIGLRVNIAHGRLNAIVPGYVLQREGVGAAASRGKKGVSQPVEAGIRVGLDCAPKRPICVCSTQAPRGSSGLPGWLKTKSHFEGARRASSTSFISWLIISPGATTTSKWRRT